LLNARGIGRYRLIGGDVGVDDRVRVRDPLESLGLTVAVQQEDIAYRNLHDLDLDPGISQALGGHQVVGHDLVPGPVHRAQLADPDETGDRSRERDGPDRDQYLAAHLAVVEPPAQRVTAAIVHRARADTGNHHVYLVCRVSCGRNAGGHSPCWSPATDSRPPGLTAEDFRHSHGSGRLAA